MSLAIARTLWLLLDDVVGAYNTTKLCATKPVGIWGTGSSIDEAYIMLCEAFLRTVVLFAVASALAIPARAQSMQVYGKTGYLGEYELSGTVSEQASNGRKDYSGPLIAKHVGLCTHDGPQETTGQIRFHVIGSSPHVTAILIFEGVQCAYEGVLSESYHGFMNCADKTSLPLRLWTK